MNSFDIGGVEYTWDPDTRVLRNSFRAGTTATRLTGVRVVAALKEWLSDPGIDYLIIVNGEGASGIDVGYREEFAQLFKLFPNVHIAVYNFPVETRMIPILFGVATDTRLGSFKSEEEALAWSREEGFNV